MTYETFLSPSFVAMKNNEEFFDFFCAEVNNSLKESDNLDNQKSVTLQSYFSIRYFLKNDVASHQQLPDDLKLADVSLSFKRKTVIS